MENPGLLSKTSTVAKAVTSAALHSKNKTNIRSEWSKPPSLRNEEKQRPLKDVEGERKKQ